MRNSSVLSGSGNCLDSLLDFINKERRRSYTVLEKNYMFFSFCLAVVLMVECRSMYVVTVHGIPKSNVLLFGVTVMAVMFCIICCMKLKTRGVIIAAAFFVYCIPYAVLQTANRGSTIKFMVLLTVMLLYYFSCSRDRESVPLCLEYYCRLIVVVAAVSLAFWVAGSLLHVLKPTGQVGTFWTGNENYIRMVPSYFGIYFETQDVKFGSLKLTRNSAIFSEAPMASFHFFFLFLIQKQLCQHSKIRSLLLAIAIVSTVSTTGICFLVLYYLINFILSPSNSKVRKLLKLILLPLLTIVALSVVFVLVEDKMESRSGDIRLDDLRACFRMWMDHFFWGVGINNTNPIIPYLSGFRKSNHGLSNSLFLVFACGGLYTGILFYIQFTIGIVRAVMIRDKQRFILVFLLFFLFAITVIPYTYVFIFSLIWSANYRASSSFAIQEK